MHPIKNLGKLKRQVHKTKTEASIRVRAKNNNIFRNIYQARELMLTKHLLKTCQHNSVKFHVADNLNLEQLVDIIFFQINHQTSLRIVKCILREILPAIVCFTGIVS